MEDVEPFIQWLQAKGLTDEAHLAAYRRYVGELAKHPSLSAALRAAEEAGSPAREIANLRQVAGRIVEFESAGRGDAQPAQAAGPVRPSRSPSSPPSSSTSRSALPAMADRSLDVEAERQAASLDVEPRRAPLPAAADRRGEPVAVEPREPRPAAATRNMGDRRKGCICNRRYDVYLDDDFGALARLFGGGIGIGTLVLIRLIGVLGALTLALGAAGMGGLVTITSICFRCEGCRYRVRDPDADERARIRKGRGRVVLVTLALIIGAAVCGAAWWSLVKNAHRYD